MTDSNEIGCEDHIIDIDGNYIWIDGVRHWRSGVSPLKRSGTPENMAKAKARADQTKALIDSMYPLQEVFDVLIPKWWEKPI